MSEPLLAMAGLARNSPLPPLPICSVPALIVVPPA